MPINNRNNPVGIFDSGLGGLTVVKEIIRRLPSEHIVYFGDTARVPYGTKSKESIIRFSKENTRMLLKHKVKLVVVACNSSSSVALDVLRRNFSVPIVGVIDPGARKAAEITKNRKIGVIATQATINSGAYTKSIKKYNRCAKIKVKACPLFVPLAEEGWSKRKVSFDIASEYMSSIKTSRCDTVILGCTHYPLLKTVIQGTLGRKVILIDSAKEVAIQVKSLLEQRDIQRLKKSRVRHIFLVSDEPKHFQILAKRFLGKTINEVKRSKNV